METPLSSSRIKREKEESVSKPRQERALIDITNGSPIVGLATGSLNTPSSRYSKKKKMIPVTTPGSGESLLRGQVKTLLQKVEEEEEKMICFQPNPFIRNLLINSPLLPPAPANTPQLYDFSTTSFESFNLTQMLNGVTNQEGETEKQNVITRSLFMDFSDFSDSSVWSVKVNPSTSDDAMVDELCEGVSNISVNNETRFTGKHIRFVYNSEGELEGQLEEESSNLQTPKGKNLLFAEEESDAEI